MNFRCRTDIAIVAASGTLLFMDTESVRCVDGTLLMYEPHCSPK